MNEQLSESVAACQPMREKYWAELDDPQKVERLRQVFRTLVKEIAQIKVDVSELKEASRTHEHLSFTGKPTVYVSVGSGPSEFVGGRLARWDKEDSDKSYI